MDAENQPAENVPNAGIGKDNTRWRLTLLVLCVVGTGLVIGILALQVTEYLFYKAPPDVWPPRRPAAGQGATLPQTWQSGAGGTVSAPVAPSAPAALAAPLSPVTPTMPSAPPAPAITTTALSGTATSAVSAPTTTMVTSATVVSTGVGVTSAGGVAVTSAPAPAAAMP